MPRQRRTKIKLSDQELRELQHQRAKSVERCLNDIVNAALAYHQESLRDDGFHRARMSRRDKFLRQVIDRYNEAQAPISEMSDEKIKLGLGRLGLPGRSGDSS